MSIDDVFTVNELYDQQFEYYWVLENILPVGAGMLFYGQRGIGKSLMALRLALAVANGGKLFDKWNVAKPGPVLLYVQADLPKAMQRERIETLATQMPWVLKSDIHFYVPSSINIFDIEYDVGLMKKLTSIKPVLVIWDVLRKLHHLKEDANYPGLVYGQVRDLFPDSAHFYIHHDRKTTKEMAEGLLDRTESFSGAGPLLDLVVSGWHMSETVTGKQWDLETTKNNCGPIENSINLKRDDKTLLPILVNNKTPLSNVIAQWRKDNGCNPRPLSEDERESLRRYLVSSGISSLDTTNNAVDSLE